MADDNDTKADDARREARKAKIWAWVWWVQLPVVCLSFWFLSSEKPVERAMFIYLAAVSIIALAATYESKAEAAEAKKAGYEP